MRSRVGCPRPALPHPPLVPPLNSLPHAHPACRLRVLCFTSAGCAEDMFTSEGTGPRRAPSALLVGGSTGCLLAAVLHSSAFLTF